MWPLFIVVSTPRLQPCRRIRKAQEPVGVQAYRPQMVVEQNGYSGVGPPRSEEHTSELQSLMRISYAVFCLKKKKNTTNQTSSVSFLPYCNDFDIITHRFGSVPCSSQKLSTHEKSPHLCLHLSI